jgi:high-affinity nickel-transport protein
MVAENFDVEHSRRPVRADRRDFRGQDRGRIGGLFAVIVLLHALGWGLYLHYAARYPALVGLGLAAYLFGLRHAFDADHIAAIDDTVRYMLQKNKNPLAVGFFFSLGHSTVVLGLSIAIAFAATAVKRDLPQLQNLGGIIGAGVSSVFLLLIGWLNLRVLLGILAVWRQAKEGTHSHQHLESLLTQRGLINRWVGGRWRGLMSRSSQMYPLGLLFGLGFDTASEIGLLAMTAGASAGDLPIPAVLSLPLLFASGMTLLDTTDGVLMCRAYRWALLNPVRKIFYNVATTALSVAIALLIGAIELLQVGAGVFGLDGGFFRAVAKIDFADFGYLIVGLFLIAWAGSVIVWKWGAGAQRASRGATAVREAAPPDRAP